MSHRQVKASRAVVDEGLAPLLELVWAAGIDTQFSCQGTPSGNASIVFPDVDSALRFMSITMERSHWYNRLTMKLMEPIESVTYGGVGAPRACVEWPVTNMRQDVTVELTKVWACEPLSSDYMTRKRKVTP
jgi:hypothetical protein